MSIHERHALASAVTLLVGTLLLPGCRHEEAEDILTEAAVPVVVAPASRRNVREVVTASAVLVPQPDASFTITAPLPARVLAITRAEGDHVAKGEVLVRFQVPSLDAELAARGADRAKSRVRIDTVRASLEREESLRARGIASRKDVDDARREVADAAAALAEAEAATGAASLLAERAVVRARFDGVVARRWHNPGDLVDASSADPVLRVIDPARIEVEASVPAARLSGIEVSAEARVFNPGPVSPQMARVLTRPGVVDSATGSGIVRLVLTCPPYELVAGTVVRVEIDGREHASVIAVPKGALVREGERVSVYVVTADGHAERKDVVVGLIGAEVAEVSSGLAEGESVVIHGQGALPDGAAVTVAP